MLQFNYVHLHNFASYQDAEVNLQSRGFCLVTGRNNYKKDNSLSNGCGKSFIWNAICYTLTGETIKGVHTKLVNTNPSDDDSYTKLDFTADNHHYTITRWLAPKTDMQIIYDNTDVSGKGIRESEKKLGELLPDLNRDLISSVIILGQGMPNKFSSFSPSGRKDLLERLTKSDFMIDLVKTKVAARHTELDKKTREYADSQLVTKTKITAEERQLALNKNALEQLKAIEATSNYDKSITEVTSQLEQLTKEATECENTLTALRVQYQTLNEQLIAINSEKSAAVQEENNAYTESYNIGVSKYSEYNAEKVALEKEIKKLKSSNGICPTCGQKLPGFVIPDTKDKEVKLAALVDTVTDINSKLEQCRVMHADTLKKLDEQYASSIAKTKNEVLSINNSTAELQKQLTNYNTAKLSLTDKLRELTFNKENNGKKIKNTEELINASQKEIASLHSALDVVVAADAELQDHIAVIKKMETLLKRDFRGYLLSNIIKYLNTKAKDFSEIVYGTRDLDITLDGNALDITYCGKIFDNLSGGEQQRVDLILQFALRDLLKEYLNINSNILVLDEITDFLDKKSCAAVMNLVTKELNSVESVFIISHHDDELNLPIDSELKIIKTEDGISEVY